MTRVIFKTISVCLVFFLNIQCTKDDNNDIPKDSNIEGNIIKGDDLSDRFGRAVSLNKTGKRFVVGAPQVYFSGLGSATGNGYVRVFESNNGNITQLGEDINGTDFIDGFGTSVSMSDDGTIIAVGAPLYDNGIPETGQVRIFKYISNNWVQIGNDINSNTTEDFFGYSISLNGDGTLIAIGAPGHDSDRGFSSSEGYVEVYEFKNNIWSLRGNRIINPSDEDFTHFFGASVAINDLGTILSVSSQEPFDNDSLNDRNASFTFNYSNNSWKSDDVYFYSQGVADDNIFTDHNFCSQVSLSSSGNIRVYSSPSNYIFDNLSRSYIHQNIGGNWQKIGNTIFDEDNGDYSGASLQLNDDGNLLIIGSPFHHEVNAFSAGHARVFKNQGNNWVQLGNDFNGENNSDFLGTSVSISGNGRVICLGAPGNDETTGYVRIEILE